MKSRIFRLLEGPWQDEPAGKAVNLFIIGLIAFNVLAVVLESVDALSRRYGLFFELFEIFSVLVFTVEYALRLWVCTENPRRLYARPIVGRLRYAVSPMALIDILAIAPFYLTIFFAIDLRFLRVFRLLRLFKLTRYSPAAEMLGSVVYNERRTLFTAFLLMLVLLIFASSVMYVLESETQPQSFSSIPAAMWWGMVTLTGVGYGDVTPVTPMGKLLGAFVAVLGIGTFAVPAGILASGFAQEMKKRDFIASWNVVARVPLFARLTAAEIAEFATLLKPRFAVPGERIVAKGDEGDAMYFISSGRVEVEIEPAPVQLGGGDFFGEIALLHACKRTANVTAVTSCQLLVLDRTDFGALVESNETIREAIDRVAQRRLNELNPSAAPPSKPADSAT